MDAIRLRLSLALLAGLVSATGCRSFAHDGPVPAAVAASRQLSLEGTAALARGESAYARQCFEKATKLCPSDLESRRRLADLVARQGDLNAAIAQLDEARKIAPDDHELAVQLGEVCFNAGQSQRALQLATQAIDRQPDLPRAWTLRGRVHHQSGQFQAALADYLRALDYAPNDRAAMILAAQLYLDLKRPERAWTIAAGLRQTYEPAAEPPELLALEARILSDLGRTTEAAQRMARIDALRIYE
jgi:tetratricopeptide (TPR) repeat protein